MNESMIFILHILAVCPSTRPVRMSVRPPRV